MSERSVEYSGSATHRILRSWGIVSRSSSSRRMVFWLGPLGWRRILALTMRVDVIVGVARHWGRTMRARPAL